MEKNKGNDASGRWFESISRYKYLFRCLKFHSQVYIIHCAYMLKQCYVKSSVFLTGPHSCIYVCRG